jgi:hypothetical protein
VEGSEVKERIRRVEQHEARAVECCGELVHYPELSLTFNHFGAKLFRKRK